MSGTFSGINTALSALRFNRLGMDVSGNNIANVSTEGYVRQRVVGESVGAPSVPAMWSRYEGAGDGVSVTGVQRMSDAYLDRRARTEHGHQSYLDARIGIMARVEEGIGEPGDNGVSAALGDFHASWYDLANNPDSDAARSQVLGRATTLAEAISSQVRNIDTEAGDQRARIIDLVAQVNSLSSDLASTNDSIIAAKTDGTDVNALMDQRDQLALRLAELIGATAVEAGDGSLSVTVGGISLVNGIESSTFAISSGITATGDSDGNPVAFTITDPSAVVTAVGALRGEVGGVTDVLNVVLPDYRTSLGQVAQTLADQVNAQHVLGFDKSGAAGVDFFAYNPADPASTLTVAIASRDQVAASSIPGGYVEGANAAALAKLDDVDNQYQRLVNSFGTDVASTYRLATNQTVLTAQIDASREQLAGVSLDEEMVNMLTYQRGFEAASRLMTTIDSILDTLINRTGLLR